MYSYQIGSEKQIPFLLIWIQKNVKLSSSNRYLRGHLELVCEEILLNIFRHAYQGKKGIIRVEIEKTAICFIDFGPPFNPLLVAPPLLSSQLEERPIGGLGLHLIRQLVDTMSYVRENNCNRLIVFFE